MQTERVEKFALKSDFVFFNFISKKLIAYYVHFKRPNEWEFCEQKKEGEKKENVSQ